MHDSYESPLPIPCGQDCGPEGLAESSGLRDDKQPRDREGLEDMEQLYGKVGVGSLARLLPRQP